MYLVSKSEKEVAVLHRFIKKVASEKEGEKKREFDVLYKIIEKEEKIREKTNQKAKNKNYNFGKSKVQKIQKEHIKSEANVSEIKRGQFTKFF